MLYKSIIAVLSFVTLVSTTAWSQTVIIEHGAPPPRARFRHRPQRGLPVFHPSLNFSAGYGFPIVDTKYLPEFYGVGRGDASGWGVIAGSLDYQFSRRMSIGVMVAHESISAPYYGYFSPTDLPDLNVHLDNWAFMISLTRYFPVSLRTSLYLRTAIGGNAWQQAYTDASGNKVTVTNVDLPALSHQLALGMKFRLAPQMALLVEGGYGKYIVRAGLSVKL